MGTSTPSTTVETLISDGDVVIAPEILKDGHPPPNNIDPAFTNSSGDDMSFFAWDGPQNPDEEIEEFTQ